VSAEDRIEVGARVVHTQVPGVFIVLARRGALLEIESERGLRMTVRDIAVRRVHGSGAPPGDT